MNATKTLSRDAQSKKKKGEKVYYRCMVNIKEEKNYLTTQQNTVFSLQAFFNKNLATHRIMWRGPKPLALSKRQNREGLSLRRVGQPASPPFSVPPNDNENGREWRAPYVSIGTWVRWLGFFLVVLTLLALGLVALSIVYGVLEQRDSERYLRTRNDITQLRQRNATVVSVGFYARKASQQPITPNIFTTVVDWTTSGGAPAYDSSNGAMNFVTGVWTTPAPGGKFQVSGAACWTPSGGANLRQLIFLINGGVGILTTPFTSTMGMGQICTTLSVNLDLPADTTVEMQVQRGSGNPGQQIAATLSTFGIERLANL